MINIAGFILGSITAWFVYQFGLKSNLKKQLSSVLDTMRDEIESIYKEFSSSISDGLIISEARVESLKKIRSVHIAIIQDMNKLERINLFANRLPFYLAIFMVIIFLSWGISFLPLFSVPEYFPLKIGFSVVMPILIFLLQIFIIIIADRFKDDIDTLIDKYRKSNYK